MKAYLREAAKTNPTRVRVVSDHPKNGLFVLVAGPNAQLPSKSHNFCQVDKRKLKALEEQAAEVTPLKVRVDTPHRARLPLVTSAPRPAPTRPARRTPSAGTPGSSPSECVVQRRAGRRPRSRLDTVAARGAGADQSGASLACSAAPRRSRCSRCRSAEAPAEAAQILHPVQVRHGRVLQHMQGLDDAHVPAARGAHYVR